MDTGRVGMNQVRRGFPHGLGIDLIPILISIIAFATLPPAMRTDY
jgi:spore maturation protein SpmB